MHAYDYKYSLRLIICPPLILHLSLYLFLTLAVAYAWLSTGASDFAYVFYMLFVIRSLCLLLRLLVLSAGCTFFNIRLLVVPTSTYTFS